MTEVMSTYFYITKLEVYLNDVKVNLSLSGGDYFCVISKHYYMGCGTITPCPFGNPGPANGKSRLQKVSDLLFVNIKAISCSQKDICSQNDK